MSQTKPVVVDAEPTPEASEMPADYSKTVLEMLKGATTPNSAASAAVIESLKQLVADHQALTANIQQTTEQLGVAQRQKDKLDGAIDSLVALVWKFESAT